uniref:Uncharacterized protein n=1 Tax=Amazona collaria TaxID=241587 RepID=A0A8B9IZY0_9PSIT
MALICRGEVEMSSWAAALPCEVLRRWHRVPRGAVAAPSLQCSRPGWTQGLEHPAPVEGVPSSFPRDAGMQRSALLTASYGDVCPAAGIYQSRGCPVSRTWGTPHPSQLPHRHQFSGAARQREASSRAASLCSLSSLCR